MKVKDVMKTDVGFCMTDDSLMKCADIMRSRDCGVVPILNREEKLVGMLTDRDLCLAIVARNRKASDVSCGELLSGRVITCSSDDKLEDALKRMRKYRIKRLPAVGKDGKLAGIFSITDVLLSIRKDKSLKKKAQATLKMIFKPRPIVLRENSVDNTDTDADTYAVAPNS